MSEQVEIWSTNETPRCGSGRRLVDLVKKTRTYVWLRSPGSQRGTDKVTRKTFDRICVS